MKMNKNLACWRTFLSLFNLQNLIYTFFFLLGNNKLKESPLAFTNRLILSRIKQLTSVVCAQKFVCETRRAVAERAENIGIWFKILEMLAQLAVISNVSDFKFMYNW